MVVTDRRGRLSLPKKSERLSQPWERRSGFFAARQDFVFFRITSMPQSMSTATTLNASMATKVVV